MKATFENNTKYQWVIRYLPRVNCKFLEFRSQFKIEMSNKTKEYIDNHIHSMSSISEIKRLVANYIYANSDLTVLETHYDFHLADITFFLKKKT